MLCTENIVKGHSEGGGAICGSQVCRAALSPPASWGAMAYRVLLQDQLADSQERGCYEQHLCLKEGPQGLTATPNLNGGVEGSFGLLVKPKKVN